MIGPGAFAVFLSDIDHLRPIYARQTVYEVKGTRRKPDMPAADRALCSVRWPQPSRVTTAPREKKTGNARMQVIRTSMCYSSEATPRVGYE